jgi:hypothetical protein
MGQRTHSVKAEEEEEKEEEVVVYNEGKGRSLAHRIRPWAGAYTLIELKFNGYRTYYNIFLS